MEKTDSVLNLTKPSLYGIYNSSSQDLAIENEQVEEYIDGKQLHIRAKDSSSAKVHKQTPRKVAFSDMSTGQQAAWIGTRITLVSAAAFVYNEVTKNIHTFHVDKSGKIINAYLLQLMDCLRPTSYSAAGGSGTLQIDALVALCLEGLALSSILPVLDRFMPSICMRRMLSSNPNPYRRDNLGNDVLRSLVAFLGISYAMRKVEWQSSLQMALAWSSINPGLWLLLDGTISGFLASIIVAAGGSATVYVRNLQQLSGDHENSLTVMLFVASFFFCGVIIFGKLGRLLFGSN